MKSETFIQLENIMKKLLLLVFAIPILFINYSCGDSPTSPNDRDTSIVVALKPNIYIYPNQILNIMKFIPSINQRLMRW